MKEYATYLFFTLLMLVSFSMPSCNDVESDQVAYAIPTLEETLSAICARKAYSDSLQARFEVDTIAQVLVENYMALDSSFSQKVKRHHHNLEAQHGSIVDWKPLATGTRINLDEDPEEEVVCFLGAFYSAPHFLVFDYVNGGYVKVLDEYLWLHNEHPKLKILRLKNKNIVRTGHFYYRGSGHWLYAYQCYAMSDGEMNKVAEFPYRATLALANPIMSSCDLVNDSITGDTYLLEYSYSAKVGNQLIQTKQDSAYREFQIVKNYPLFVSYIFDDQSGELLSNNESLITQLMSFDNDTCAFELIKPYLKEKNSVMHESFKKAFKDSNCSPVNGQ